MCYVLCQCVTLVSAHMPVRTVSVREMRNSLGHLETLVLESGELVITKRGKAIARVLPVAGRKPKPGHADLRKRMPRLNIPSEDLIAADRAEC